MPELLDESALLLTPELQARVALAFGVPLGGVYKAAAAAMPTILAAIADRAGDAAFMDALMVMVTHPAALAPHAEALFEVVAALDGSQVSPLLDLGRALIGTLFGERAVVMAGISGRLAGFGPCGDDLLAAVACGALCLLAQRVRRERLSTSDLAVRLVEERERLRRAIPAPMAGVAGVVAGRRTAPAGAHSSITTSPRPSKQATGRLHVPRPTGPRLRPVPVDSVPAFARHMHAHDDEPRAIHRLIPVIGGLAAVALVGLVVFTR